MSEKTTKRNREQKYKEQIELLDDIGKIRIGKSDIHGVGIIATRNIKKGAKLHADSIPHLLDLPYKKFKNLRPEIAQMVLERFPQIFDNKQFHFPDARMLGYMNHSDDPNYDEEADRVIRSVKMGEEITKDYRRIPNWAEVYKWLAELDDKNLVDNSTT